MDTPVDIDQILRISPHRWPFVLVDRITAFEPGVRIAGHKCVSFNEPWFLGHFPGRAVMPGVLILEAFAQLGGVLLSSGESSQGARGVRGHLLSIDGAKFRRAVVPGDKLDLEVRLLRRHGDALKCQGDAFVDGTRVAEGALLLALAPTNEAGT